MNIEMIEYPTDMDWMAAKRRALVTVGKTPITVPDVKWKRSILEARHSPIRRLNFSFLLHDVPYCTSVHLVRHHEGCQPYVRSQRNDRQSAYDRKKAPQDAPVDMIWDMNAETLMNIANKRLCVKAEEETRALIRTICEMVDDSFEEFRGLLVPMCEWCGGLCHEMYPCGRYPAWSEVMRK